MNNWAGFTAALTSHRFIATVAMFLPGIIVANDFYCQVANSSYVFVFHISSGLLKTEEENEKEKDQGMARSVTVAHFEVHICTIFSLHLPVLTSSLCDMKQY
jgi:hypothetical protein